MSFGTFKEEDVTILLKDITGIVEPLPASEREPLIQSGVHYSEMLPLEYEPTEDYTALFNEAMERYSDVTAKAAVSVSKKIVEDKGEDVVLVSLARAGIPVGIIIKKCIDENAMKYIRSRHDDKNIQFIDGWTGKGAIQNELITCMKKYPDIDPMLAVLSDPANISGLCGTHEDFLIASSCLNSTVSGLLSRTFLRDDVIGENDFHGAAYYKELKNSDDTYRFIDAVCLKIDKYKDCDFVDEKTLDRTGVEEVEEIAENFGISDINLVKPGIGEATRVLLRRVPWKILAASLDDYENLGHLYQLAKEKGVPVEEYPLKNYRACGIIKEMADT